MLAKTTDLKDRFASHKFALEERISELKSKFVASYE